MMDLHYGMVEDIQDPQQLGRVRARVFGVHSASLVDIPTEDLPWASVMQPTTSAANSGVGTTPRILPGSLVVLSFLDKDKQLPLVIGTLPSQLKDHFMTIEGENIPWGTDGFGFQDPGKIYPKSNYINDNDLPKGSRSTDLEFTRSQHTSTNDLFDITEPEDIRANHTYPHNQVRQSESGHFEEWDDTAGNERLNRQHKSGTFEEIRPDGSRVTKIVQKDFEIIAAGQDVYISGGCNIHVEGNHNFYVNGDQNIHVTGNVVEKIDGSADITVATTTKLTSGTSVTIDTPSTTITGTLQVNGAQTNSSTITATGEITSGTIKLTSHRHKGVKTGGSLTQDPV